MSHVSFPQFLLIVTSYITIVHYQNQELMCKLKYNSHHKITTLTWASQWFLIYS